MSNSINSLDYSDNRAKFYHQLVQREQQWWRARQRLVILKQRQISWYGDNSLIMWLLCQVLSYVVVAIILMLVINLLQVQLALWHCVSVFGLQTLFFILLLVFKNHLAKRLQNRIHKQELAREQAFNEMAILASDSIFPDIHANAPISLQHIYERYGTQLRRASLQRLLQHEIDAGRMFLGQQSRHTQILPPEFDDNELIPYASKMIYKSVI